LFLLSFDDKESGSLNPGSMFSIECFKVFSSYLSRLL
jgi:hypothetical protein